MTTDYCDLCVGTGYAGGVCCGCGGTGYQPSPKKEPQETTMKINTYQYLKRIKRALFLPSPTDALKEKIETHERELTLAEERRQHAVSVVDYHQRTLTALKHQLNKLEKEQTQKQLEG